MFKQSISEKAHNYGANIYKVVATNGYTWNDGIYTGEQDPMTGLEHAQKVVLNLLNGLLGGYRSVVAHNYFTSISVVERLLEHKTYLFETLRSNRAGSGNKVLQKKLRRDKLYALQNKDGIKLILWKDKRDVPIIFIRPPH